MNGIGDQFLMRYSVAFQPVPHDRSWCLAMRLQQSFKEFLSCSAVATILKKHIDDFPVLVDRSSQIVLDTTDLDEHLIKIERIVETLVPAPQSSCILRPKFIAP